MGGPWGLGIAMEIQKEYEDRESFKVQTHLGPLAISHAALDKFRKYLDETGLYLATDELGRCSKH